MTIYKKPDLKVFGANAKPTEIAEFEDLLRGWGVTIEKTNGIPPMEWFNYLFNRLDGNINYILQNGITEYDTNLEYPQNAVVKSGGKLYLCLRQNTNKPLSNGTYWELLIKNATTSQKGVVELSSSVTSTDETKASTPKATKVAYDKATQADNNANSRVSKNGGKINGSIVIDTVLRDRVPLQLATAQKFDIALSIKNNNAKDRYSTYLALAPENQSNSSRFYFFLDGDDGNGHVYNKVFLPSKAGVLALTSEVESAYNKAVQADNNANSRVSKAGDTMAGNLVIHMSDYSEIKLRNNANKDLCFGGMPDNNSTIGNIIYRDVASYENISLITIPKKDGTMLLDSHFTGSISRNGWCRLPNGLIMQWLTFTSPCSSKRSWPIAFTQIFNVTSSQTYISSSKQANFDSDIFYTTTQVWGRYQNEVRVFAVGI